MGQQVSGRVGGVAVGDYTFEGAQEAWAGIVERMQAGGQRPEIGRVFDFGV